MNDTYNTLTRLLDVVIALNALFFLSPILALVACILRFTGEREVFYLQERVGRRRQTFHVIKFATMLKNSPNVGAGAITLKNDPRVLPIGALLRKTKINELPQLINILMGDMSIVGPRPLMIKQFGFYNEQAQELISNMRPGLTGLGSIAFRDEEQLFDSGHDPDVVYRNKIAPVKAILETWFYNNRSVLLYFKLIFLTVVAILCPNRNVLKFLDNDTKERIQNVLQKP
ncbi:sugar transferase [Alphaproteobacteria bacterium]|nr:sugar transferase [Alphaproteobacteria bacterium]